MVWFADTGLPWLPLPAPSPWKKTTVAPSFRPSPRQHLTCQHVRGQRPLEPPWGRRPRCCLRHHGCRHHQGRAASWPLLGQGLGLGLGRLLLLVCSQSRLVGGGRRARLLQGLGQVLGSFRLLGWLLGSFQLLDWLLGSFQLLKHPGHGDGCRLLGQGRQVSAHEAGRALRRWDRRQAGAVSSTAGDYFWGGGRAAAAAAAAAGGC